MTLSANPALGKPTGCDNGRHPLVRQHDRYLPDRACQSLSVRTNVYGRRTLDPIEADREPHHDLHRLVFRHETDKLCNIGGNGVASRTQVTGNRYQGSGKDPVGVTHRNPDTDLTDVHPQSPTPG